MTFSSVVVAAALAIPAISVRVAPAQYARPVDTAPPDEDIGTGYETPPVQRPKPRAAWWDVADMGALALALGLSAWFVLRRRSRNWFVALAVGSLLYFGFYREGCICPIGAIQNMAVALTDPAYSLPLVVTVFFTLPLILALLFGRVFCGGVCPLGAIQELVLLRAVQVPRRLDRVLGWFKYVYLVLAVWFAVQPAPERDFIICRFDPFVGFFRLAGPADILIFGGSLLVIGLFIGRPYCRYLCPYGALLSILSRFSWRGVTITPDRELDCGLCAEACPYGAIEQMRAVRSACLFCARCFDACPREHSAKPPDAVTTTAAQIERKKSA